MNHECFACERIFTVLNNATSTADVPAEYRTTYCSAECFKEFEAELAQEVARANDAELNTSAQESQATADTNKDAITRIINGFHMKVKI